VLFYPTVSWNIKLLNLCCFVVFSILCSSDHLCLTKHYLHSSNMVRIGLLCI